MRLIYPKKENQKAIWEYRQKIPNVLRTTDKQTYDDQLLFYESLREKNCPHIYFDLYMDEEFIGFGGLTYIDNTNRSAEISLLILPEKQKNGYGFLALDDILSYGFDDLKLNTIVAECYKCNPKWSFWVNMGQYYKADVSILPERKYWNEKFYDSIFLTFRKKKWEKCK